VADCTPVDTDVHTPDLRTCSATARPARAGVNLIATVPACASTKAAGMVSEAVCATTLNVLAPVRY
jgi:hypothetical protein